MAKEEAATKRFKPVSLGIMFLALGFALNKASEFSQLDSVSTTFMYTSLALSIILLLAFFLYLITPLKPYFDRSVKSWIYPAGVIYLFGFTINWLLSLRSGSTDPIFHLVFWLGFLWFSVLTIILCTSLYSDIKYVASGIMFGSGIPLLYSQNYIALLCLWIVGAVIFVAARKNWDWTEYFPI